MPKNSVLLQPEQIPVLLTSSVIAHDTRVKLANTNDRLRFAVESVREWLRISPHQPIVLCDGSSFDFSPLIKANFPQANVECIFFENNQEAVQEHGRGFGEGEIVRHALQHSRLIKTVGAFAKCSSKLWVENFLTCAKTWNGDLLLQGVFKNVFQPWRQPSLIYIDTRFYIANCESYRTHFELAHHRIDDKKGFSLEDAFLQIVIEKELQNIFSPTAPVICGVGGGIGKYYKSSLKRRMKESLKLLIVKRIPQFQKYFIVT